MVMNLWSNIDIRPGGFPRNLDPVGEGGGGCLRPARAAVLQSQTIISLSHIMFTKKGLKRDIPEGCAGSLPG